MGPGAHAPEAHRNEAHANSLTPMSLTRLWLTRTGKDAQSDRAQCPIPAAIPKFSHTQPGILKNRLL